MLDDGNAAAVLSAQLVPCQAVDAAAVPPPLQVIGDFIIIKDAANSPVLQFLNTSYSIFKKITMRNIYNSENVEEFYTRRDVVVLIKEYGEWKIIATSDIYQHICLLASQCLAIVIAFYWGSSEKRPRSPNIPPTFMLAHWHINN